MQSQLSHMTALIWLQPFTTDSLKMACTGLPLNLSHLRSDGECCVVLLLPPQTFLFTIPH